MFYFIGVAFMLVITSIIAYAAHYESDHFEENHRFMRKYFHHHNHNSHA